MMEITFLCGELVLAAAWLAVRACVWIRARKIDWKRELLLLLMYVNLAVILRVTFYPAALSEGRVASLFFDPVRAYPFRTNLVPLKNILDYDDLFATALNVAGNVGLFVPSGILFPFLYRKLDTFGRTVLVGFLLSLTIELLQLPFFTRTTDVDDLILNTAGAVAGYALWALARLLIRKWRERRQTRSGERKEL